MQNTIMLHVILIWLLEYCIGFSNSGYAIYWGRNDYLNYAWLIDIHRPLGIAILLLVD